MDSLLIILSSISSINYLPSHSQINYARPFFDTSPQQGLLHVSIVVQCTFVTKLSNHAAILSFKFDGHFTITRQKYESGPSINYRDGGNRSLRAKDDSTTNEPGDGNCDEGDAQDDETVTPDEIGDGENADELTLDKDAAYSHRIAFKPDVLDQTSYTNMDLDVHKDATLMEDGELNEQVQLAQNRNEGNQHEETALLMKLWKRQIQKLT